jgi:DNA-binding Xre family transcriptional regulator
MRLSAKKLKKICKNKHLALTELLAESGVSRTAYYSLIRKNSLLPSSLLKLCQTLGLSPTDLLEESLSPQEAGVLLARRKTNLLLQKNPQLDPDNIFHTFLLLQEKPISRLKRALLRSGRK